MGTIHGIQTPSGWARSAAHQEDGRTGFGEWLRQARKARGLTLDDISRETKIPLRNLEALEHGDLGAMPAFYQRAEVRAIARAVGVDEQLAIARLNTAITPAVESREEPKGDGSGPRFKPSRALVFVALAFGVLLAAAGIGPSVLSSTAPPQRPANAVAAAGSSAADTAVVPVRRLEPSVPASQQTGASEPAVAPGTAAPASVTEIVVTTVPSGAWVTVNGISWGVSPVTIRHLPPGAKRIRVTKDGFAATEQMLALDEGQRQTLNLRLSGIEPDTSDREDSR